MAAVRRRWPLIASKRGNSAIPTPAWEAVNPWTVYPQLLSWLPMRCNPTLVAAHQPRGWKASWKAACRPQAVAEPRLEESGKFAHQAAKALMPWAWFAMAIPPPPVEIGLPGPRLKRPKSPLVPTGWPSHLAPRACAASSMTTAPAWCATAIVSATAKGIPKGCTSTTAKVSIPTAVANPSGSYCIVCGERSTKTG